MNKIKISLVAATVVFAFATTTMTKANVKADDPFWITADGQYDGQQSAQEEATLRGCNTGSLECATGYESVTFDPQGNPIGHNEIASLTKTSQ